MAITEQSSQPIIVSYAEYDQLTESLARKIYLSQWSFDSILCLARGGLRVGDLLSRLFAKPLAILATSSYQGENEVQRGELTVGSQITMANPPLKGAVLLVDDLVDSGHTLAAISQQLSQFAPSVTDFRTAVLWWKASSILAPDYYVEYLPNNPWIQQPFEKYDRLRITDLLE